MGQWTTDELDAIGRAGELLSLGQVLHSSDHAPSRGCPALDARPIGAGEARPVVSQPLDELRHRLAVTGAEWPQQESLARELWRRNRDRVRHRPGA